MKNVKSLFALLTLVAVSFACAPVADSPITEAPSPAVEVSADETAFPWIDEANNCCEGKPILSRPKI